MEKSAKKRRHSANPTITVTPLQPKRLCQDHLTFQLNRSSTDPALLTDDRVLANMLKTEDRHTPSATYFACVQKDIQPWMRNRVSVWMLEVCEEQRCEPEVFPTAINYLDRFLSVRSVDRTQLQLLAAACMFVASKLRESIPLSAQKLVVYTDLSITLTDLLQWEMMVLHVLRWDLACVTPHDLLPHLIWRLPLDHEMSQVILKHAKIFTSMCLTSDFQFAQAPPSMLSAACLSSAMTGILGQDWCDENHLQEHLHLITATEHDCLSALLEQVEKALTSNLPTSHDDEDTAEEENEEDNEESGDSAGDMRSKGSPYRQPRTPTDVREIGLN